MRFRSVCWTPIAFAVLFGGVTVQAQGVCDGVSAATNTTQLETVVVANGFSRPVFITSPPGDTGRLIIVEQAGTIRLHKRGNAPGTWITFMDISARVNDSANEQGLLGLAFHPDYQNNGFFYVNYTDNTGGDTVISRFTRLNADQGDPGTETTIMEIDQPQINHNAGWLGFGPNDGYLYISTGDGGGGGDVHGTCGNGQEIDTLLGKMLRIDVDNLPGSGSAECASGPFSVPADNPFVDTAGCDEIWAYGLRNPWRDSHDRATGDLYIGDVGQGCWEEVSYQSAGTPGGVNFGWRQMEGLHCYNPSQGCFATDEQNCTPACDDPSLTLPILDFRSTGECSVVGGYAYRGCRMSNFDGTYFYGDYCTGIVRSTEVVGGVATNQIDWTSQIGTGFGLLTFGEDAQGEIYIGTEFPGEVRKIVPPLSTMEVSGRGADLLTLARTSPWTWEDLEFNSMIPLNTYRVYRAIFNGNYDPDGVFICIHDETSTSWGPAGDPLNPDPGQMLAYVVTARNPAGDETGPGGTPARLISCP